MLIPWILPKKSAPIASLREYDVKRTECGHFLSIYTQRTHKMHHKYWTRMTGVWLKLFTLRCLICKAILAFDYWMRLANTPFKSYSICISSEQCYFSLIRCLGMPHYLLKTCVHCKHGQICIQSALSRRLVWTDDRLFHRLLIGCEN